MEQLVPVLEHSKRTVIHIVLSDSKKAIGVQSTCRPVSHSLATVSSQLHAKDNNEVKVPVQIVSGIKGRILDKREYMWQ